mgnify:CR=1 FL=1
MGFFGKIKDALKKTKEGLGNKLRVLFARDKIGEDFYDDLLDALISSDISVSTADEIVESVRDRMIEEKVKDKEVAVEALRDALKDCLNNADEFDFDTPAVLMVIGVNGVGKTTSIGKLAHKFVEEGKSVTIAAADTFRAAASDQLEIWAKRAKVKIVKSEEGSDPSAVVFDALTSVKARGTDVLIIDTAGVYDTIAAAKARNADVIICDTAGRLHTKSNLMEELRKMSRIVEREYPEADFRKLIALDATTGQNALNQVEVFNEAVGIDGVILTKLDGTAKGGIALAIRQELEVPVWYIGVGEGIDDLQPFNAKDFVEALF